MSIFKGLAVILMILISLAGCENKNTPKIETKLATEWVKPAAENEMSAAYLVYINRNEEPDTLLSVASNAAEMAQIHESVMKDKMMTMQEKPRIVIEPGDTLQFRPGGLHIMLMNLNQALTDGDSTEIILKLSRAGSIRKTLPVKRNPEL